MQRTRVGGRPAQVTLDQIERAGRSIGLLDLTVNGVAVAVGVTPTALYRHVDGRAGLERLVGESILAELVIVDRAEEDAAAHLMTFATTLRDFLLQHPGLSAYLQVLFPRGSSGVRLLEAEVEALMRRGYAPDIAIIVSSNIAGLAIAQVAAQERQDGPGSSPEIARQRDDSLALIASSGLLAQAFARLPQISHDEYFRLVMSGCIRGLLTAAPPGRQADEIIMALGIATPTRHEHSEKQKEQDE